MVAGCLVCVVLLPPSCFFFILVLVLVFWCLVLIRLRLFALPSFLSLFVCGLCSLWKGLLAKALAPIPSSSTVLNSVCLFRRLTKWGSLQRLAPDTAPCPEG